MSEQIVRVETDYISLRKAYVSFSRSQLGELQVYIHVDKPETLDQIAKLCKKDVVTTVGHNYFALPRARDKSKIYVVTDTRKRLGQ